MSLRLLLSPLLVQACDSVKRTYEVYAERSSREGRPWSLKPDVIFLRIDTYRERNVALSSVTATAQEFSKLEKIEICGSKGARETIDLCPAFVAAGACMLPLLLMLLLPSFKNSSDGHYPLTRSCMVL